MLPELCRTELQPPWPAIKPMVWNHFLDGTVIERAVLTGYRSSSLITAGQRLPGRQDLRGLIRRARAVFSDKR